MPQDTHTPRTLSFSQSMMWTNPLARSDREESGCQMKWAFRYIWRVPQAPSEAPILGDGLHAALEADGHAKINGSALALGDLIQIARDRFAERIAADDPGNRLGRVVANTQQRMESMLARYVRSAQERYHPSAEPEQDFTITLAGVPFTGKIDAQTPNAILDWKNTKALVNKWGKDWLDQSDEHRLQASAYLLAKPAAQAVRFVVFASGVDSPDMAEVKTYTVPRDDKREAAFEDRIGIVAQQIEEATNTGRIEARTSPLCAWCPYIGACAIGRAAMRASARPIVAPQIPYTVPCECGADASVEGYAVAARRGLLHCLCKSCGLKFDHKVTKPRRGAVNAAD